MRILIVDDHPLYRDALGRLLPQIFSAAIVVQADDWASAQACLESGRVFDLVLLDLELPGADGRQALEVLRRRFPDLKVVVISASEDAADARRCLAAGARGFIPKSARTDVLAAALHLVDEGGSYLPPLLLGGASARLAQEDTTPLLTAREREILELVCAGLPNKAIAKALHIAEPTVRAHLSSVFRALGVINRTQAARVAHERGLTRKA